LDVGQADSILIQTKDNAVLIDAGESVTRRRLISYLEEAGIKSLDYFIATHPHNDHIGGFIGLLGAVEVKNIVMPDAINTTATFENLIHAAEDNDIPIYVAETGDFIEAGLIALDVLSPGLGGTYPNLNNASLVLRMVYGDTAFLFMGDAEEIIERQVLGAGFDVRANILKVGHHGSKTSTSAAFLDEVRPNAAVISCGKNNTYGHPDAEVLSLLAEPGRDIMTLRTDERGTIIMVTDGNEIRLYMHD
ncbi:MAG: MBL fold metallo-hydrolase, partial [Defluviitaleaceae bacterium]|nr:MBL fold metallo-hydrolase [Defluviitaleaceae bacterium]